MLNLYFFHKPKWVLHSRSKNSIILCFAMSDSNIVGLFAITDNNILLGTKNLK